MSTTLARGWIGVALVAGLAGAIPLGLYFLVIAWSGGAGAPHTLAWVASIVTGDAAFGSSWGPAAGVVVFVLWCVAWGVGYLWAAQRQRQLLGRPLVSGVAFGVVVWLVSLAMEVPAGKLVQPTIYTFDREIVGYTLFFGVPLAFVAARLSHRA